MNVNVECTTPTSKQSLMKKIMELGFAITDLNLFLDTHPECEDALILFKKCVFTLKNLQNEYQAKYGPLKSMEASEHIPFNWIKSPWPWEKEV